MSGIAASFNRIIRKTDKIIKIYLIWFSAQDNEVNLRANIGMRDTISRELTMATETKK